MKGLYTLYLFPVLALLLVAVLACGPADMSVQERIGNVDAQPQDEESTPMPAQTQEPEPTPVTIYRRSPGTPGLTPIPGHTRTPTNTPRPTLIPDSTEAYAAVAAYRAKEAAGESGPDVAVLAAQVENFTREKKGGRQFHSIVPAKVTGHRLVEPNLDIEWPDRIGDPPFPPAMELDETYTSWRRTKLQIEETYLGPVPQGYELLAADYSINMALEEGKEYIIYILRGYVAEDTLPNAPGIYRYNAEQLKALGGEGGLIHLSNTWLIDGETAWLLPRDGYMTVNPHIPGLTAAREHGHSMPVTDLVAAIKRGLRRPE